MRRAKIEEQNGFMLRRQREFRVAADVVAKAWVTFPEVQAIAVIGSVAKPLWKEIPRFREFRQQRIEVWHECGDLDLALWMRLLRRVSAPASSATRSMYFCSSRRAIAISAGCAHLAIARMESPLARFPA